MLNWKQAPTVFKSGEV